MVRQRTSERQLHALAELLQLWQVCAQHCRKRMGYRMRIQCGKQQVHRLIVALLELAARRHLKKRADGGQCDGRHIEQQVQVALALRFCLRAWACIVLCRQRTFRPTISLLLQLNYISHRYRAQWSRCRRSITGSMQ